MPQTKVVFDITNQGFEPWRMGAFFLIFVAMGLFFVLMPKTTLSLMPGGLQGRARRIFGWVSLLFATALTAVAFWTTEARYLHLLRLYNDHRYAVVQGCLTSFHPAQWGGHDDEVVQVEEEIFSYRDSVNTGTFNHTEVEGGPIHRDSFVKIYFIRRDQNATPFAASRILRLEVADHACEDRALGGDY